MSGPDKSCCPRGDVGTTGKSQHPAARIDGRVGLNERHVLGRRLATANDRDGGALRTSHQQVGSKSQDMQK